MNTTRQIVLLPAPLSFHFTFSFSFGRCIISFISYMSQTMPNTSYLGGQVSCDSAETYLTGRVSLIPVPSPIICDWSSDQIILIQIFMFTSKFCNRIGLIHVCIKFSFFLKEKKDFSFLDVIIEKWIM